MPFAPGSAQTGGDPISRKSRPIPFPYDAAASALSVWQSNDRWNEMTGVNWVGMLASTMPLIAFELGLGCPPVAAYIRRATDETAWAGHLLTLVVPGAWLINTSFGGTFDGLALGFWVVTSYAMVGALKQVRHEPALTWTDCTVLLLTMPLLDYRWFEASYYYGMTWYARSKVASAIESEGSGVETRGGGG